MSMDFNVLPKVFKALHNLDIKEICTMSTKDIRPILPCLVRMTFVSSTDNWGDCAHHKLTLLAFLSEMYEVDSIIGLLAVNFLLLEAELKKEQISREQSGNTKDDSTLVDSPEYSLSLVFEKSNSIQRLKLVSSEIFYILSKIKHQSQTPDDNQTSTSSEQLYLNRSDLFDYPIYIPEICDVLCIILWEFPTLITLQELTEALVHVKNGPVFICRIVANFPDCFYDVCTSLMENAGACEKIKGGNHGRLDVLIQLTAMYPCAALVIRTKCVELRKIPALTVILTLENYISEVSCLNNSQSSSNNDLVTFVLSLLFGNDEQAKSWFSFFIRQEKKNNPVNIVVKKMRDQFLSQLQNLLKLVKDNTIPTSSVMQANILLKLYCALKTIAGIKFQEEEIFSLVSLITCFPPSTPEGVKFATMGLCLMVCCYNLLAKPINKDKCVQWLKLAGSDSSIFGKPTDSKLTARFGEMLLLIAIHFHCDQLKWIYDYLMCITLGMKINIRLDSMGKIKKLFTKTVFPEKVVVSRCVNLPVTPNLNAKMSEILPINCILQLLKGRVFSRHCINIKPWIYNQICVSVSPIHPSLPPLIEAYISLLFSKYNKKPEELDVYVPITEEEILKMFGDNVFDPYRNKLCTAHILLLYYLFLYEDKVMTLASHPIKSRYIGLLKYNTEFLANIPIQHIVQQTKRERPFSNIFSTLLRHMTTHFPYLSQVEDWMDDPMPEIKLVSKYPEKTITTEMIESDLKMMVERPKRALKMLRRLCADQPINIWPLAPTILKFLQNMLDSNVPTCIQELYKKVWLRLNIVFPRTLWALTMKELQQNTEVNSWNKNILTEDPLQILRCDSRVFRCPVVLNIVTCILKLSLIASRSDLTRLGKLQSFMPEPLIETNNREKFKNMYTLTQDSAVVLLLLEACMETDNDKKSFSTSMILREVQGIICSFVHQMFTANPPLAKLVHLQGYRRELLPITSRGIPSMDLCLDFVEDFLEEPVLQRQIFCIDLISYVSQQHPQPKSHNLAQLVINTMQTFLSDLTHERRREFYTPTLPALVRICKVFPNLIEDCLTFLNQLSRISLSVTYVRSDILLLNTTQSNEEIDEQTSIKRILKPDIHNERSDVAIANKLFVEQINQIVKEITSIT